MGEVGILIMVQDAPLSGSTCRCFCCAWREIEMVKLFKIECPAPRTKLRVLIAEGGDAIEAPMDGEEAITLLADLDAGATGASDLGLDHRSDRRIPSRFGRRGPRGRDGGYARPHLRNHETGNAGSARPRR